MVKYLRHYWVDALTNEFLLDTNISANGKTHPPVADLDVKFWFQDQQGIEYCYSLVPAATSVTIQPGIQEVTFNDLVTEVANQFEILKNSVANNPTRLNELGKTQEEVLAFTLDTVSVDSMLSSFEQFNKPLN